MMAVDFDFNNIISIVAQELFGGNTTVAGLVIMLAIVFICMAFLSTIKAPIQYSLVPMIIMAVIFATMGIMDPTVSFLIIILSAVLMAATARKLLEA